jgi:hypothetical protein
MKCHTCQNEILPGEPVERINPWPWDELIVCEQCYDWRAWTLVSARQIREAAGLEPTEEEPGSYAHGGEPCDCPWWARTH